MVVNAVEHRPQLPFYRVMPRIIIAHFSWGVAMPRCFLSLFTHLSITLRQTYVPAVSKFMGRRGARGC